MGATRSSAPYTVSIFEARCIGGVPRRTTASSALCRRGAHAFLEGNGDDADTLWEQPPGVWRAMLSTKSDGHRYAVIGRHQRASGGKTAHEGNAPQRAIDRHGHLDCPHRGREAGVSRSVAFPELGRKKGQRTPVSYKVTVHESQKRCLSGCAEGAVMRRFRCDVAQVSHVRVPVERRI